MSLRNIKKLQSPENLLVQTESDEDSEEITRLKKNSSSKFGGFDLVCFLVYLLSSFNKYLKNINKCTLCGMCHMVHTNRHHS